MPVPSLISRQAPAPRALQTPVKRYMVSPLGLSTEHVVLVYRVIAPLLPSLRFTYRACCIRVLSNTPTPRGNFFLQKKHVFSNLRWVFHSFSQYPEGFPQCGIFLNPSLLLRSAGIRFSASFGHKWLSLRWSGPGVPCPYTRSLPFFGDVKTGSHLARNPG